MLIDNLNKTTTLILVMCILCTSYLAQNNAQSSRQNQTPVLVIKGKIIDKNGEGVPFANVWIDGTKSGNATDFYGFYEFMCLLENLALVNGQLFFDLKIGALGYEDKTIPVIIAPSTEPIVVAEINTFLSISENIGQIEITRCYIPLIDK